MIQTGTIAVVAVAFARVPGVLLPQISESHKFFKYRRFVLSPTTLVAIGVLVLLTWSNSTGLKAGKLVQNIFTITKIAALLGLILLGLLRGANDAATSEHTAAVCERRATQPGGLLRENPPGGTSFACGPRWLRPYSTRRGCAGLAALAAENLSPQDLTQFSNRR